VAEILLPSNDIFIHHDDMISALWMRGDLEFLLWPQQIPIWDQLQNLPKNVVEFVVLCARQFGKSVVGVIYALSEAIKHRDCCILIMGPDTKQTIDIVAPKMRMLTRTAPPGLIKQMKSNNRYHVYHDLNSKASDYTEIVIGGMNENSSSQRGKTVHKILVEEIVDVAEDNFITSVRSDLGPALTHSRDGKIVYLTTLPKYPNHPFITITIPNAELKGAIARFTIDDNIALDQDQKDKCAELSGGINSTDYKREFLCEIVRDKTVVCLPDFDVRHNVAKFELPLEKFMSVTIDWGGVRDKTCAMLHCYDYISDLDLIWDERVFEPNTATSAIVAECRRMEGTHRIFARYVDAPPQLVTVDLLQDHGYAAQLPEKLDWRASLNTLNVRFARKKALIHPRCVFLIVSAESAILNKNKTDFDRNIALGHMDGIAAMMYGIRMQTHENPYSAMDDFMGVDVSSGINRDHIDTQSGQQGGIPLKAFGRFRS